MSTNEDELIEAIALMRELTDDGTRHSLADVAAELGIGPEDLDDPPAETLFSYLDQLQAAENDPGRAEVGRSAIAYLRHVGPQPPRWEHVGRLVGYLGGDINHADALWRARYDDDHAVPIRVETAPDTPVTLASYLRGLRLAAGQPSLRTIGNAIEIGRSTVDNLLKGVAYRPQWRMVAALVSYLDGDLTYARRLWQEHVKQSRDDAAPSGSAGLDAIAEQLDEITCLLRRLVDHLTDD